MIDSVAKHCIGEKFCIYCKNAKYKKVSVTKENSIKEGKTKTIIYQCKYLDICKNAVELYEEAGD